MQTEKRPQDVDDDTQDVDDNIDIHTPLDTFRTILTHRDLVRDALQIIIDKLTQRATHHDESKFKDDEFQGFCRISAIAKQHPYGSQAYQDALAQERDVIQLHYQRNRHHPEHHEVPSFSMNTIDLIEMVCDWYSAWKVYGEAKDEENRITWEQNIEIQRERFGEVLAKWQWNVVDDIALTILEAIGKGDLG